jgi:hypothetical protein
MSSVFPSRRVRANQTKVRLMHQSGTLQGVTDSLVPELKVRQTAQFLVDQRQQLIEGLAVAAPPALQKFGYLVGKLVPHNDFPPVRGLGRLAYPFQCVLSIEDAGKTGD